MALRPVDLQQVVMKAPDASRDPAAQNAAASAHQAQTAQHANKRAQQAETVQQFEEAGAILIRDRDSGNRQQQEDAEEQQAEAESFADEPNQMTGNAPQARLGRHIDLQA